jgi:hypothetical protein
LLTTLHLFRSLCNLELLVTRSARNIPRPRTADHPSRFHKPYAGSPLPGLCLPCVEDHQPGWALAIASPLLATTGALAVSWSHPSPFQPSCLILACLLHRTTAAHSRPGTTGTILRTPVYSPACPLPARPLPASPLLQLAPPTVLPPSQQQPALRGPLLFSTIADTSLFCTCHWSCLKILPLSLPFLSPFLLLL